MTTPDANAPARDDAGGHGPSPETSALDDARAAVLRAVQQAVEQGNLPDEDAAGLVTEINAFTDLFALDEWVFEQPLLKKRFCRYPLCFNPPRPPREPAEGRRRGGNPPAYCATGIDHEGQPHNGPFASMRSIRRREQLRGTARADPAPPVAPGRTAPGEDYPVSRARDDMPARIVGIVQGLGELTRQVAELREVAATAGDDEARWTEMEEVRHEARKLVEKETGLRLAAERRALEARALVNRLEADLGEANAAADEAAREVDLAHAQRDEARDRAQEISHEAEQLRADTRRRLDEAHALAQWLLAEARWQAENTVAGIRQQADQQLSELQEEADRLVQAAQAAARETADAATQREIAADRKVAAAEQVVREARTTLAKAEATAQSLTRDNARLRDEAVERERAFEQRIDALHQDFERRLNELRDKHERDLADRLAQTQQAADALHQAEIATLTATNELLSTKLDATNAELAALRADTADTTRS